MRNAYFFIVMILVGMASFAGQGMADGHVLKVGFAQDNMGNDWRAAQVRAAEAVFKKHPNVEFIYTDAGGDVAKNVQDIEDLADQGIDLLMISPRSPSAMTPVISALYKKGVHVILLTRRTLSADYTTFIGPDDAAIAAQAADQVARALDGEGRVLVLQGVPTATTAQARTSGFVDRLEAHPGLSIVEVVPANYLRADAIKAVQAALEKGMKFDAIYAQSDSMAAGARTALTGAGLSARDIPIVGIDYIKEARAAIRSGEQFASFTYPTAGDVGAEMALKILKGESVPREIAVPSQMVTRENVDRVDTIF